MSKDTDRLRVLIDRYWDCAWAEGNQNRHHDTVDGLAQTTRSEIEKIIDRLEPPK